MDRCGLILIKEFKCQCFVRVSTDAQCRDVVSSFSFEHRMSFHNIVFITTVFVDGEVVDSRSIRLTMFEASASTASIHFVGLIICRVDSG